MIERELSSEEAASLASRRDWIANLLAGVGSDTRLAGTIDDIPTLHSLVSGGPYTSDAASELIVLGTAFGDVLAHELQLRWVVVEDENGAEFALRGHTPSEYVFPCEMLLKRVEAGQQADTINLAAILEGVRAHVQIGGRPT